MSITKSHLPRWDENGNKMKLNITTDQLKRVEADFTKIAGEKISITYDTGRFMCLCSEIASLRLLKAYRTNNKANQQYSENLNSFVFTLDRY